MPSPRTADHESAARALLAAYGTHDAIEELPVGSRPLTRRDGYAIQELFQQQLGQVIGWKVAASTRAGQAGLGIDKPLAGRIFAAQRQPVGVPVSLTHNRMRTAEPEIGFVLGRAIRPRSRAWSLEEVVDAVESLELAWDVPSTRLREPRAAGASVLLADNAFAHQVLSKPSPCADWRRLDLARHRVVVTSSEGMTHEGTGALALGDPRCALVWLANEVTANGANLEPGQLVITGSLVAPVAVHAGVRLTADFADLGSLTVDFKE